MKRAPLAPSSFNLSAHADMAFKARTSGTTSVQHVQLRRHLAARNFVSMSRPLQYKISGRVRSRNLNPSPVDGYIRTWHCRMSRNATHARIHCKMHVSSSPAALFPCTAGPALCRTHTTPWTLNALTPWTHAGHPKPHLQSRSSATLYTPMRSCTASSSGEAL